MLVARTWAGLALQRHRGLLKRRGAASGVGAEPCSVHRRPKMLTVIEHGSRLESLESLDSVSRRRIVHCIIYRARLGWNQDFNGVHRGTWL